MPKADTQGQIALSDFFFVVLGQICSSQSSFGVDERKILDRDLMESSRKGTSELLQLNK